MVVQGTWCRDDINRSRQLEKPLSRNTPGLRRRSAGLEKDVSWCLKDGGWWCRDDINRSRQLEKSHQQKHTWFEKEVSWT